MERERESWEITLCFDAGNLFTTQALFLDLLFMCVFDRKMWGSGSVIAAALMFHSCIRWPFSIVYKHVVSLQIVHSRPNIRYYLLICIYLWKEKSLTDYYYLVFWCLRWGSRFQNMADTNSEIFTSFQSNNDGRKCFDNWNMFLVGILTFKIVVCVCHIEMSIYRNKRERSTSKLCYIREKSRERTVATSLTTLSTARRSLRTRHLYTTNMLIFWAPSFVLSAGVPQFSIYESAVAAVVTSAAFPLRELLLLQL